jgi:deoxyribodipyrimidine photo-lyase
MLPANLTKHPRARWRNKFALNPDGMAVVYWMQRAQRAIDNPALDYAIRAANALGKPVVVFLAPVPFYPNANQRHYAFLLSGVADIADGLVKRRCGLVYRPYPHHSLLKFCEELKPALVVSDENPLREPERWRVVAGEKLTCPLVTIDADVIVPSSHFPKEEFAARTIRPKILRLLDTYLVEEPEPKAKLKWNESDAQTEVRDTASLRSSSGGADFSLRIPENWKLDKSATILPDHGGTAAGLKQLRRFVSKHLAVYPDRRNHPEFADGTSRLSAYLHFGHLGPRQIAPAVSESHVPEEAKEAFLEELIVRRELAINFVRTNPNYDRYEGLHPWARRTLEDHLGDKRPYLYSSEQLENAETHDPLWNAAQVEMVRTGRMHGYMRMYWAKKILEWTDHPARAMEIAIRLNDRYELDGRDPNGYTGIAWAIGGKHDRPWTPRPIFGTIRFMSYASTSKKFNSKAYIARVGQL